MNKICAKCKENKNQDQFYFRNKKRGVRHSYCNSCKRIIDKENYKNDKNNRKSRIRDYANEGRKRRKNIIKKIKEADPCVDCKKSYPSYVMDFDHISDNKEMDISRMRFNSIKNILKEISKCEIVCSNCHRIRTHNRKYPPVAQSVEATDLNPVQY